MIDNNLREMLKEKGISLREFALLIDYDREAVRKFANKELVRLPIDLLERTCKALHCDLGDLLELKIDE